MEKTARERKEMIRIMKNAEQLTLVRAIRGGLVNITPVLIIGAFALILKTFPVAAYQSFIGRFAGGLLLSFLDFVYGATFGVLSIYMTVSISRSYVHIKASSTSDIGAILSSLLSFFILAGAYLPAFGADSVGPKSMFLAIITGIGASALYLRLHGSFTRRQKRSYSSGADREFNQMLFSLAPIAITAAVFAAFNALIVYVFRVDSFRMLLTLAFDKLFSIGSSGFLKGLFFVLLSSLLWFFGIHGSDTLESVMQTYFAPGLAANQAAAAAGEAPAAILTKEFFDCFVLMGGCGAAICLLIAILIFSRSRARRGLGLAAAFPMIFNINELMVFGLPIIFNPIMLIPFITVPLACYTLAYLAIASGLVPAITGAVEWTTPIILGGFHTTHSFAGSALQLVNVAVGVAIYFPFVRILDREDEAKYRREYESFVEYFRHNEQNLTVVKLIELDNVYGEFAKLLCAELEHSLKPQYGHDGRCIGAEALLRWNHPVYGIVYPPIVIKLAEEGGFLEKLEETVLQTAIDDRPELLRRFGDNVELSVNVTGSTVVTPRFLQFCRQLDGKTPLKDLNLCLEVTEQAAVSFGEETINNLQAFREFGIALAIDDFSMGQTSVNYLKENLFDVIKLDGSLVKGLLTNRNCREIVISISQLASNLRLTVLAEYVETEAQRDALHEAGCDCYQGYLYSPAVFLSDGSSALSE